MKDEWICTSDRFPERDKFVLGWMVPDIYLIVQIKEHSVFNSRSLVNHWIVPYTGLEYPGKEGIFDMYEIEYWQELPTAPKIEEELIDARMD